MLRASRAETIAIGHGRHTASAGAADALAAAWTAGAGQVLAVVDWPAAAAVKTVCLGWYWQPCQYTRTARDVNGQPVARSPAGSP